MPKGGWNPVGKTILEQAFLGICDPLVGVSPWSSVFLKHCNPLGGTHAAAIYEELQPMGRTLLEEACGGLHTEAGEECQEQGDHM